MCGFAGFLCMKQPRAEADTRTVVEAMASAIRHRGPDDAGAWVDAEAGIALGHRRLSILDLSTAGHQPMASHDGRYIVVFNGEIYNFAAIRDRLLAHGCSLRGECDTEVLVEAIAAWGVRATVEHAVGMFAFVVWDRSERVLTLARDRMGEKPLYYGWAGSTLLFGSELKALRRHPDWSGEVDREALTLFMRHNYVPAPLTIYRGIRKLPPACTVQFLLGAAGELPAPEPYWMLSGERQELLSGIATESDTSAVDALEQLLRDAVRLQMVADVPVGAFLSGGIDSSTVVALMQAESSRPVRTFTIGVHDSARDEAPAARAVAQHLGTDHTELYVTPEDALGTIPQLSTIYDEPFADSSQIPTLLVSRLARCKVTVALSGDGGDELFGGYPRYVRGPRLARLLEKVPLSLRRGIGTALLSAPIACGLQAVGRRDGGAFSERLMRLGEVLRTESPLGVHRALLTNWVRPTDVVRNGSEPATALTDPRTFSTSRNLAERMLYVDSVTYLPDDLLVKVDRASMAVSLETRLPLLDHRLVEFAWNLPWHMKVREGQQKWILRQILFRHVPEKLVDRPKRGFGVPLGPWLRGPLRDWAEELLRPERIAAEGFFRPKIITRRWREHKAGTCDWSYPLWTLLMFQTWLEAQQVV
jgi:asparagine synthase (glutamine-hydrolysing)